MKKHKWASLLAAGVLALQPAFFCAAEEAPTGEEPAVSTTLAEEAGSATTSSAPSAGEEEVPKRPIEEILAELDPILFADKTGYAQYLSSLGEKAVPAAGEEILLSCEHLDKDASRCEIRPDYEGKSDVAVTDESGRLVYRFQVEEAGLYHVAVTYRPLEAAEGSSILRSLAVNGEVPFFEASSLTLDRVYALDNTAKEYNNLGDEIRPEPEEIVEWREQVLTDRNGASGEPFYWFYFEKGENTVTLDSVREEAAIAGLRLFGGEEAPDGIPAAQEGADAAGFLEIYQCEENALVNDFSIAPASDRSSLLTQPHHLYNIRYNTLGGSHFSQPGQWVSWTVEVPEEGLYNLAFRLRQNSKRDLNAYLSVLVNGELPYAALEALPVAYAGGWQQFSLEREGESLKIPLKKGKNTISVRLTASANAELISRLEESLLRLNYCSRQILMLTGSQPDTYRDYQFDEVLPDVLQIFEYEGARLYELVDLMEEMTGEKGSDAVTIENVARQVTDMAKHPTSIAGRLDTFRSNLTAMGTWLATLREIPVDFDYFVLYSDDRAKEVPRMTDNFFEALWKEITGFAATFIYDYQSTGRTEGTAEPITVWVGSGRDQAQIIKNLADSTFTRETGLQANIQLVSNSMLMPSIMAGTAPDVALQQGNMVQPGSQGIVNQVGTLAVEWGLRGALHPLSEFPDFASVVEDRFESSLLGPLGYEGVTYALPETQSFSMLFYRRDILEELGAEVPQTWDEVVRLIPLLQSNQMTFGFAYDFTNFNILLAQHGIPLYKEGFQSVNLDSPEALEVFLQFTDFTTVYRLPLLFDFNNRFRTGETPIGISDFSTYNMLQVLAPEIAGLWDFCELPGVRREDGSIDRTSIITPSTSCFITEQADSPENAWEFLKWWTREDTQSAYARSIESVLGASGRYMSANKQAFAQLPWTAAELAMIERQREQTAYIPQVLGGYMVVRQFDNAFRAVAIDDAGAYNNGEEPRYAMLRYVEKMNEELRQKAEELAGLRE